MIEREEFVRSIEKRMPNWAFIFYLFGAICGFLAGVAL